MSIAKVFIGGERDVPKVGGAPLSSLALFLWFFLSTKISFPFNYFQTCNLLVKITKLCLNSKTRSKSERAPSASPPAGPWSPPGHRSARLRGCARGFAWGSAPAPRGGRRAWGMHVMQSAGAVRVGCAPRRCAVRVEDARAEQGGLDLTPRLPGFPVVMTTRRPATVAGTSR